MASQRHERYDPLSSNPTETLHASRMCLALVGGVPAPFSGKVLDCTLPCTGTKDQACQITRHLSAWNEALMQGFYELSERPTVWPQLALVSTNQRSMLGSLEIRLKVATLLYYLIKKHHCVTMVDIEIGRLDVYDDLLCDALRDSDHIEGVNIVDFTQNPDNYKKFFSVIQSLKYLLHFRYTVDEEFQWEHPEDLVSTLKQIDTLEALHIPSIWNYDTDSADSADLLCAVFKCASLKELSLNFSFIEQSYEECCDLFSDYLRYSTTLTTLSLKGQCEIGEPCGKLIMQGLRDNKSILKLELDEVFADNEGLELIASIFAQNIVLRNFCIHPDGKCIISEGGYCDSWLPSLLRNESIEEMTLPFQIWRVEQWAQLFGALSTKQNLKRITIGWRDMSGYDLYTFCKALCEGGVEEKVIFASEFHLSHYANDFSLVQCKSFVDIRADYDASDRQLRSLVAEVCELNHVTSLTLGIALKPSDKDPLSPVADLIRSTTSLRTLRLFVSTMDRSARYENARWKATIESLSKNRSITRLVLNSAYMKPKEIESLADVIRFSGSIRRLSIRLAEEQMSGTFQKHLSRGLTENYTLVSVDLLERADKDTFTIRDTVRRNCVLVARASQFRMGAQLGRATVCALERVFRHRALLEEFADVECISVDDAAAALRAELRELDDMDSFMRMAGVVRSSVVCHAREDGRKQLDDLNEPCLRALRSYLFLDYVVT